LSAKSCTEEELKKYISSYYWAKSHLTENEQLYINECFVNNRYEDEIVDMLEFTSSDGRDFKRLKRSAIFKFADLLDLVIDKE